MPVQFTAKPEQNRNASAPVTPTTEEIAAATAAGTASTRLVVGNVLWFGPASATWNRIIDRKKSAEAGETVYVKNASDVDVINMFMDVKVFATKDVAGQSVDVNLNVTNDILPAVNNMILGDLAAKLNLSVGQGNYGRSEAFKAWLTTNPEAKFIVTDKVVVREGITEAGKTYKIEAPVLKVLV